MSKFKSQWTPCSERNPEDGISVLLTYEVHFTDGRNKRYVIIAYYDSEDETWLTDTEDAYIISYPIAWMPLPETYSET